MDPRVVYQQAYPVYANQQQQAYPVYAMQAQQAQAQAQQAQLASVMQQVQQALGAMQAKLTEMQAQIDRLTAAPAPAPALVLVPAAAPARLNHASNIQRAFRGAFLASGVLTTQTDETYTNKATRRTARESALRRCFRRLPVALQDQLLAEASVPGGRAHYIGHDSAAYEAIAQQARQEADQAYEQAVARVAPPAASVKRKEREEKIEGEPRSTLLRQNLQTHFTRVVESENRPVLDWFEARMKVFVARVVPRMLDEEWQARVAFVGLVADLAVPRLAPDAARTLYETIRRHADASTKSVDTFARTVCSDTAVDRLGVVVDSESDADSDSLD